MTSKSDDNYYSLLKVDPKATVSEIVAAYHAAKNAFAKDSIATYSLFSSEDTQTILEQLEEAYLTLSNIEKRRQYDRNLTIDGHLPRSRRHEVTKPSSPEPSVAKIETSNSLGPSPSVTGSLSIDSSTTIQPMAGSEAFKSADGSQAIGHLLRDVRTRRGLSIEDVGRITKIPSRCIRAIEEHDTKNLPARVYLQGFLKNMAALYHLNPKEIVPTYLTQVATPADAPIPTP